MKGDQDFIGLLGIPFSINVGSTQHLGSSRSLKACSV